MSLRCCCGWDVCSQFTCASPAAEPHDAHNGLWLAFAPLRIARTSCGHSEHHPGGPGATTAVRPLASLRQPDALRDARSRSASAPVGHCWPLFPRRRCVPLVPARTNDTAEGPAGRRRSASQSCLLYTLGTLCLQRARANPLLRVLVQLLRRLVCSPGHATHAWSARIVKSADRIVDLSLPGIFIALV